MANPYFSFKYFTICQDRCAMKVGTDGVLLGAWFNVEGAGRILDAGTGTGLIALMVAQRSGAIIDAVEIDHNACVQAGENVAACPWHDRIRIYHDSFQHFARYTENRYDLIVSNPPWFRNSLKPPVASRTFARHDEMLPMESLLHYGSQILTVNGRFAIVLPADSMQALTEQAYFNNLFPFRITRVRSVEGKPHSRCLVTLSSITQMKASEDELTIRNSGSSGFTPAYQALIRDYYPAFQIQDNTRNSQG